MSLPLIAIAPMMDCTDRHYRYFLRLIAPHVLLYTEMIPAQKLIHGNCHSALSFHPDEKYLALQLGGSDPNDLAYCAKLGEEYGYDEINLNVGCPSPRVSKGAFGACLMLQPELVAECVSAMQAKIAIPVTVKCRIGIDHQDSYEALQHFIQLVANAGCKTFIIHARKAWLSGLSPKQNREIPPLKYEVVRQIKQDFPHLKVILNGGLKTVADIENELPYIDGVMIGREAYSNPYFIAEIENKFFSTHSLSRIEVLNHFIPYAEHQLKSGIRMNQMTRHLLGLFKNQRGALKWRRYLSEYAHKGDVEVIKQALNIALSA